MAISNIYNTLGWTNFYQSSKLLKAGLDGETADMYIPQEDNTPRIVETSLKEHHAYYPCWSLGRLIWLIPENYRISLDINYQRFSVSNEFSLLKRRDIYSSVCVFHTDNNNLIDSVVEAIIWLLENNNINKVKTNG